MDFVGENLGDAIFSPNALVEEGFARFNDSVCVMRERKATIVKVCRRGEALSGRMSLD